MKFAQQGVLCHRAPTLRRPSVQFDVTASTRRAEKVGGTELKLARGRLLSTCQRLSAATTKYGALTQLVQVWAATYNVNLYWQMYDVYYQGLSRREKPPLVRSATVGYARCALRRCVAVRYATVLSPTHMRSVTERMRRTIFTAHSTHVEHRGCLAQDCEQWITLIVDGGGEALLLSSLAKLGLGLYAAEGVAAYLLIRHVMPRAKSLGSANLAKNIKSGVGEFVFWYYISLGFAMRSTILQSLAFTATGATHLLCHVACAVAAAAVAAGAVYALLKTAGHTLTWCTAATPTSSPAKYITFESDFWPHIRRNALLLAAAESEARAAASSLLGRLEALLMRYPVLLSLTYIEVWIVLPPYLDGPLRAVAHTCADAFMALSSVTTSAALAQAQAAAAAASGGGEGGVLAAAAAALQPASGSSAGGGVGSSGGGGESTLLQDLIVTLVYIFLFAVIVGSAGMA
ncbi:hypothetical protein JKP88DRAFT_253319 [Tribonema minus]|uniref:Uncharacterized protein n=1 Tax=Tribonema minus TaxID=303371 RepID=A0A835Z6V8_9STRA|nr:hypothetical protein JKP88DRAFT_253319 [Tribonema minus]